MIRFAKTALAGLAQLGADLIVPTEQLGTGTADNTTFLRGDKSWANPSAAGGVTVGTDGWVDDSSETWTYASGSGGGTATFTVSGDVTAKYTKGVRIKLTQSATVKYFIVLSSSVAGGTTTVTISAGSDYTLANSAISAKYHSNMVNPQGYPTWFNFTSSVTGFSSTSRNIAKFSAEGSKMTLILDIFGNSNATTMQMTAPVASLRANVANPGQTVDNGAIITGVGLAWFNTAASATLDLYKTYGFANWSATSTKGWTGFVIFDF